MPTLWDLFGGLASEVNHDFQLRPYQQEAIDKTFQGFREFRKQLGVAPTGSGKTICFAYMAQQTQPEKTLILAHRGELLTQAIDKIRKTTGIDADLEKAEDYACREAPVVVASVQSMIRRYQSWPKDHFGLIVVDEAHHTLSKTYLDVLNHFNGTKIIGVTATPDRGDRKNLGRFYENVAFDISLKKLIKDGFLAPIKIKSLPIEVDLSEVRTKTTGDYDENDLDRAVRPILEETAQVVAREAGDRKILVFLPLIATSKDFTAMLLDHGLKACHVDGKSPDRAQILEDYKNDKYRVLCNSMLLTEGYDEPSIDTIVMLRPTQSRPLFCLDDETEILTPEGWKKHYEPFNQCAAFHTDTEEIEFVVVDRQFRRSLLPDEYFVSLSTTNQDIRVTNNHRMIYDNKRRNGWKIKPAEYIANLKDGAHLPVAGYGSFCKGLPLTDAEIRFIGWVMMDGCISKSSGAISISQSMKQPWINDIENCLTDCGFKFGTSMRYGDTNFKANAPLKKWWVCRGKPRGRDKHKRGWGALESYISKEFAERLYGLDRRQFAILLEAMHLADGHKQPKNADWTQRSYHITKGNKRFIDRLQIACILNGYRANVSTRTKGRKSPIYTIHIKDQNYCQVGSTRDTRATWTSEPHSNESCWCVSNRLGTIITRRNGKVTIMGQSQVLGRGTRIHPGKDHLLFLDLLYLHEEHSLICPAHLVARDEELAKAIAAKVQANPGRELDLFEVETEANREREAQLEQQLRERKRKRAKTVDAMEFFLSIGDGESAEYEPVMKWQTKPATEKQIAALTRFGIDPESIKDRGHASVLMDAVMKRTSDNLATPKQVRWLKNANVEDPHLWTFDGAKDYIDQEIQRRQRWSKRKR